MSTVALRWPDVIGVGTRRCASSTLHDTLNAHPEIAKPERGLHFFSQNYERGGDWYCEQLAAAGDRPRIVEFSVSYTYPELCRVSAERIAQHHPGAKIFLSVRNPIERAFSDYLRSQRHCEIAADVTFEQAIEKHPELLERGRFAHSLETYLEFFPRDQVAVLFFDDLQADRVQFFKHVLEFIGVDPAIELPEKSDSIKGPKAVRWPAMQRVVLAAKTTCDMTARRLLLGGCWDSFKNWNRRAYQRLLAWNTAEVAQRPETRRKLRAWYDADIHRLEELTNRSLAHWQ